MILSNGQAAAKHQCGIGSPAAASSGVPQFMLTRSCVRAQLQGSFCHLGGHGEVHAPTQVIYVVNSATAASPTSANTSTEDKPKDNIDWLKGLAAAVLFVEALLGVALPLLRGVRPLTGALNGWLLSLLNCFAGGVFITFGERHALGSLCIVLTRCRQPVLPA